MPWPSGAARPPRRSLLRGCSPPIGPPSWAGPRGRIPEESGAMAKKTLKIKLVHSTIGEKPKTVGAVRSLGLRKINQVTERPDTPDVRGLVAAGGHLVGGGGS